MEIVVIVLLLILISMLFTELIVTYTMKGKDWILKKNIYRLSLITLAGLGVIVLWMITKN